MKLTDQLMKKILDWLPIILCVIIALFLYHVGIGVGEIFSYFTFAFIGLIAYATATKKECSRNKKIICASIVSILVLIVNYFVHWAAIDWRCTLAIASGLLMISLLFTVESLSIVQKLIFVVFSAALLGGSGIYLSYQIQEKQVVIREYDELVAAPTVEGCENFIMENADELSAEYIDDVLNLWAAALISEVKSSDKHYSYWDNPINNMLVNACGRDSYDNRVQAVVKQVCDSLYNRANTLSTLSSWEEYYRLVPKDYLKDAGKILKGYGLDVDEYYASLTISNNADFAVTYTFWGPEYKQLKVPAGKSKVVSLKKGKYYLKSSSQNSNNDHEIILLDGDKIMRSISYRSTF